jgi:hypothetical protein
MAAEEPLNILDMHPKKGCGGVLTALHSPYWSYTEAVFGDDRKENHDLSIRN